MKTTCSADALSEHQQLFFSNSSAGKGLGWDRSCDVCSKGKGTVSLQGINVSLLSAYVAQNPLFYEHRQWVAFTTESTGLSAFKAIKLSVKDKVKPR